ncbi:hypothetical protein [Microcoleus sp. CAWBG58]|nr:hypothetical protein [Microcoleus sp. CAWBG58]
MSLPTIFVCLTYMKSAVNHSIALLVQFSNSGKMPIALTSSYLYTKRAKD